MNFHLSYGKWHFDNIDKPYCTHRFPSLAVTQFSMPWPVIVDSLKLAVVGFCISLSMAKSLDEGYVGHGKATRELVADVGCH